jgi:hypothetical protein
VTPPPPNDEPSTKPLCANYGNNTVCDPTTPSLAAVCSAGLIAGAVTCADLSLRCKPVSAIDPTATFDLDGALVCE